MVHSVAMSTTNLHRPFNLLLVEDDDVDSEAILRCLRGHPLQILVVKSATEALRALQHTPGQPRFAQPLVILLDLKLPGMNGLEFLQALRADPLHSTDIVIVLSGSETAQDRARASQFDVAAYLLKDDLTSSCAELLRLLELC